MRIYLHISVEQFRIDYLAIAWEIKISENPKIEEDKWKYVISDNNREMINQIYYYLTGDSRFSGKLEKGLLIYGDYGTGKTLMMKIISALIFKYSAKIVTFINCQYLADELLEKGLKHYEFRPLILDEIGRDAKKVLDFGNEKYPMQELLGLRYNSKAWTFGTSNYLDSFNEFYGGFIVDRVKEMFNLFELKGESFRK